jgi:protein-disulfide isomerase
MSAKRILSVAMISAVLAVGSSHLQAQDNAPVFDKKQTEAIEGIVKGYLLKNPEVLREVIAELNKRQEAAAAEKRKEFLSSIYKDDSPFSSGKGKYTVVEFFDYNCGYCRRALPDVVKLVEEDGKVRLVLKELPIFGGDSEEAAKFAIAADRQGKYFEMHQKLLSEPGKANKEKAMKIAKELGLDTEQLEKDAEDASTQQALDEARVLAEKLGLQGTPLYLIGDRVVPGAPDDLYDQLKAKVAEVRKDGCATTC